jgi:hypothetical protein
MHKNNGFILINTIFLNLHSALHCNTLIIDICQFQLEEFRNKNLEIQLKI